MVKTGGAIPAMDLSRSQFRSTDVWALQVYLRLKEPAPVSFCGPGRLVLSDPQPTP